MREAGDGGGHIYIYILGYIPTLNTPTSTTTVSKEKMYTSPDGEIENLYAGNCVSFMRASPYHTSGDKKILVDAETEDGLTAKQLFELSGKISNVLKTQYNIQYDDVVCIFCPNSVYVPALHFGILGLGGIVSPANIAYLPSELNHQLKVSRSKLILTSAQLKERCKEALNGNNTWVENIITVDELLEQAQSSEVVSEKPIQLPGNVAVSKDAYYCFSSGTSGVPKGVITTHQNITSNIQQQLEMSQDIYSEKNTFGGLLPMSHIFGLIKFVYTLPYVGAKTIMFKAFDFEFTLQSVIKYKINQLHVVPPMVVLFAKSPLVEKYKQVKNGIIENLMSGAAPLSDSLMDAVGERLKCKVVQGYGLTETSPVSHLFVHDPEKYNKASVGWLIPSMQARVVDVDGNDMPEGSRGELWMKGPNIMKGYLRNPEATAEVLTPDGWFRTGDVAIVDKTGQYYIVDRVKELIKSKGHQVAPAELEAILLTHPKVNDAAVVGHYVPEEASEYPRAFLVLVEGTDPLEVKKWFDNQVARHKRLWGGIVVMSAIPKSPSGKILRRELKGREGDEAHGYSASKL